MGDEIIWADRTTVNDSGYEVQKAANRNGVYRHRVKVNFPLDERREGAGPWVPGLPPQLAEGCGGERNDRATVDTVKYEIIKSRKRPGVYRHRVRGELIWQMGLPPKSTCGGDLD